MKRIVKNKINLLRDVAAKRVIKQFADKYNFVYFGRVDAREDEHELVRGLTVATSHIDNHYTVGSFKHHDIIIVERRNTVAFPGKEAVSYTWLIMQIDLKHGDKPHVFIDAKHHDETFYANMFVKAPRLDNMTSYFAGRDAVFAQRCKVFADFRQYQAVDAMLSPAITATIARHFSQFDYEVFDDRLLVYASNTMASLATLQDMLRIGIWFAEEIEKQPV